MCVISGVGLSTLDQHLKFHPSFIFPFFFSAFSSLSFFPFFPIFLPQSRPSANKRSPFLWDVALGRWWWGHPVRGSIPWRREQQCPGHTWVYKKWQSHYDTLWYIVIQYNTLFRIPPHGVYAPPAMLASSDSLFFFSFRALYSVVFSFESPDVVRWSPDSMA